MIYKYVFFTRNGESRSDLQTQRTPNPKEQDRSHLALPKPGNSYLKSPLQEKKYLCVKDEGSLNTSRTRESCSENTDPNQVQCSSRLIGSGIDRSLTKSDHSSVNTSDIDNGYKQTTPKTFKISKLKASGNKKILFKIPSPLKREHSSTIAKPLASPQIKILNAPNPLSVRVKKSGGSNGSSEMSSHAPSTGATTPRSKNSIVNAPVSISERERIQIAKTLKLQPGKVKLKIAIPDDRSAVQSSLKPGKLHSVRSPSKKMTSPQGIKYSITPMSVRTPTEKYCSPNRPITPGSATNSSQFRAARLLFQKEPKKAEPEQMHEKLFESKFSFTLMI